MDLCCRRTSSDQGTEAQVSSTGLRDYFATTHEALGRSFVRSTYLRTSEPRRQCTCPRDPCDALHMFTARVASEPGGR
eukprot:1252358-Prymnesium_polylepis.1